MAPRAAIVTQSSLDGETAAAGTLAAKVKTTTNERTADQENMGAPTTDPSGTIPNVDPRRRLRELLAVPERERTDAQWDEIVTLEIQLAPGNKIEPTKRADAPSSTTSMRPSSQRKPPSPRAPGKKHPRSGR